MLFTPSFRPGSTIGGSMNGVNSAWSIAVVSIGLLFGFNFTIFWVTCCESVAARKRLDVLEKRYDALEMRMDLIDKVLEFRTKEGKQ